MIIRRISAYIFDLYFITVVQYIGFNLYRYLDDGIFNPSMLYIINNFSFIIILNYLLYMAFSEYFFEQTLGKKLFKLKVFFDTKDLMSILIRTIIRLFPLDLFFIIIFKNKVLHDYLSRTIVKTKMDIIEK